MDRLPTTIVRNRRTHLTGVSREIQVELFRKSIHLLIAVVPFLASVHVGATVAMLATGVIFYTYAETLRLSGKSVYIISALTVISSRRRDIGHFVLGPVTLGLGAMIALMLYPEPAAAIAIFALAFGDGFSSLVGKLFGRIRIPFTGGKTLIGSSTCFVAVFIASYAILGRVAPALIIASAATIFEVLPTQDLDNVILPVGTGFVAVQIIPLFL
jgi:phytol kinase